MKNGFIRPYDKTTVSISTLDFMTGLKKDTIILKRALVISVIFHLIMLWIVFPSKAFVIDRGKGTIIDSPLIIPKPKPKLPKTATVIIKLPGNPIPDPTPYAPERSSKYIWEDEINEYDPLGESEWLYNASEDFSKPQRVTIDQLDCYYKPSPLYPELAQKIHLKGVVVVEAVWDTNGRIKEARVLSSPGKQFGFDDVALSALREWKCRPAMINGRKIEAVAIVTINFVMQ